MKILFLDDMPERHVKAKSVLIGHELMHAMNCDEAKEMMLKHKFDVVSLDHDLAEEHYQPWGGYGEAPASRLTKSGTEVAQWMATELPSSHRPPLVLLHTLNHSGAERMQAILQDAQYTVKKKPFTSW